MNSIGKYMRFTLHKALSPVLKDGAQRNLAVTTTMTGAKGVGLYWGLKVIGLDPSPLLAVFGLFGAAIGFAAKDMVSNFISGATLAAGDTFRKGDKITIGVGAAAATGVLIDMDMKYLYLEQPDGTLLLIPNSSVTTSVVSVANAANRKKTESLIYKFSAENADQLTENDQTRKGKQIIYSVALLIPLLAFVTLYVFIACGYISAEDLKEWGLGKTEEVHQVEKGIVDVLNDKLKTVPDVLKPVGGAVPSNTSIDAVTTTIVSSIVGTADKRKA